MKRPSDLPDFLRPRLRIFLSADLIGSTALKQVESPLSSLLNEARLKEEGAWFDEIAGFYRDFSRRFREAWAEYEASPHCKTWPCGQQPEFWKANGDELIFEKTVDTPEEASIAFCLWFKAISDFRTHLAKRNSRLDVKGTVWTAGFPLANSEVVFYRAASADYLRGFEMSAPRFKHYKLLDEWYQPTPDRAEATVRDFIGPAIDTGFRLSTQATARKLVISVDSAYLIARSDIRRNDMRKIAGYAIDFYYDGRRVLKGVLGGSPYPIIWADVDAAVAATDKLVQAERKIGLYSNSVDMESLGEFCECFFVENEDYTFLSFIWGRESGVFSKVPPRYRDNLYFLADWYEKEDMRLQEWRKSIREKRQGEAAREIAPTDAELTSFSAELAGTTGQGRRGKRKK